MMIFKFILLACSGVLLVQGFAVAPPAAIKYSAGVSMNKNRSALNVLASSPTTSDEDAAALRQLDKALAKEQKRRKAVMEQLNQVDKRLMAVQQARNSYLQGQQLADTPLGGSFTETTLRSAVKSMMWRVIAGSVTMVTALRFSGSMATALSIVGSDFFSKSLTMFIGERLMNKSKAGRKSGSDNVGRSIAKALIWRAFAICNTLTMSLIVAKDLSIASKIAGTDAIFKTFLMFGYERVWATINWGKEFQVEFSI